MRYDAAHSSHDRGADNAHPNACAGGDPQDDRHVHPAEKSIDAQSPSLKGSSKALRGRRSVPIPHSAGVGVQLLHGVRAARCSAETTDGG